MGFDFMTLNDNITEITKPLLDYCKDNSLFIDASKSKIIDDANAISKHRKLNEDLICDVCNLMVSGELYPQDYYKVFGLSSAYSLTCWCKKRGFDADINRIYKGNIRDLVKTKSQAKYGTDHPWQSPDVRKKIAETNMKNLGVDNPFKSDVIKAAIRQTNLRKYGYETASKSPEVKKRAVENNIIKYGVSNPILVPEIKERAVQTNRIRYGADSPLSSPEVRAKGLETNKIRYGEEHAARSPEIKHQVAQYFTAVYGVSNPSKYPIFKDKMLLSMGEEVLERNIQLRKFRLDKSNDCLDTKVCHEWIESSGWDSTTRLKLLKELCDKPSTVFSTELKVSMFLESEGFKKDQDFTPNAKKLHGVKFNKRYHDLDFYFPYIRFGIEINGLATHSVNKAGKGNPKPKDYHFRKFLKFHESGIKVISFTDWDLYNRWDSVKNIIKHHLLDEEIEESTKVEFPDLYQSLNYGLFDYDKFEEKLQLTQNFEDFVEAKLIGEWEYWDCGSI